MEYQNNTGDFIKVKQHVQFSCFHFNSGHPSNLTWLSWRPKHTLRATREAKFANLTILPYDFHPLLHKHNYMMLEFIFEEEK